LKSLLKELVPFLVADFILLALISIFPEIILFLPRMFGLV
jgi:TRAP-type C4-dicarboxylate transport system permease large subunit